MLKRMLNCPERITYDHLREVCDRRSARVYAKVRLADVLPIESSGLPEGLYEFALQAHYDFIITDLNQYPLFAVEFDGPGHDNPTQVARDAKKNELSRRFSFPLLRIQAGDLHRSEWRFDRLTELTEQWFDRRGFEPRDHLAVVDGPAALPLIRGSDAVERSLCPYCGSGMVVKHGKFGPFYSCIHFPDCRGSSNLPGPSTNPHPQARSVPPADVNSFSRQWLIAGIVCVSLAFVSVVVILVRSSINVPRSIEPAPTVTIADSGPAPRSTSATKADEATPIVSKTDAATVHQMNLLGLLIRRKRWNTEERDAKMNNILGYKVGYSSLSKQEASKLITHWDDREK